MTKCKPANMPSFAFCQIFPHQCFPLYNTVYTLYIDQHDLHSMVRFENNGLVFKDKEAGDVPQELQSKNTLKICTLESIAKVSSCA